MGGDSDSASSMWRAATLLADDRRLVYPTAGSVAARCAGADAFVYQPPLPAFRSLFPDQMRFAHPFERDFARFLDFFRIRWSYEPTSFCLTRRDDGTPAECFTPDFYLPDLRTYVELTSMRQRLVTRKHRKVRRLREQYPGVRITLLHRRDYQRLLEVWMRGPGQKNAHNQIVPPAPDVSDGFVRTLWAEAAIADRLDQMAASLSEQLAEAPRPLLLATGEGADDVARALLGRLNLRGVSAEWDCVHLTHLPRTSAVSAAYDGPPRNRVKIQHAPAADLAGRAVVLVSSVMSTGFTAGFLRRWLQRVGAQSVEVCTLLDRRSARVCDVPIRVAGFEAPADLLVGFGLNLRPEYRQLRLIGALHEPNIALPVPPLVLSRLTAPSG